MIYMECLKLFSKESKLCYYFSASDKGSIKNMVYFDVAKRILLFINILQTTYKYLISNRFDFELKLLKHRIYHIYL